MMRNPQPTIRKPRNKPRLDGSLAERAYQLILDHILRGTLPLGAVVSRRSLAEQFGMSFIPVTAALQRLERDGLLESRPRAGTRVKIPAEDEIRSRFEMREALECQTARLCAERSTFQERLDLKRSAEHLDTLFSRAASEETDKELLFAVQKSHSDLHMKIAQYARSEALRGAIESNHVLVFNWLYGTAAGPRSLPRGFHQALIDSIIAGDPQNAESAMRAHVGFGMDDVLRAIEPNTNHRWRLKR